MSHLRRVRREHVRGSLPRPNELMRVSPGLVENNVDTFCSRSSGLVGLCRNSILLGFDMARR